MHIVHARGLKGLGNATQLKQYANWQARGGDDPCGSGFGASHPGRHSQWPAVGEPHDIVDLVVKLALPDHWQAVCAERVKVVMDGNFGRALLMGSMSFSCSSGSSSICGSRHFTGTSENAVKTQIWIAVSVYDRHPQGALQSYCSLPKVFEIPS